MTPAILPVAARAARLGLAVACPGAADFSGLIVDAGRGPAFHGYPCREGTLFQYRRTAIARARMGEVVEIVGRLRRRATPSPLP